MNRKEKADVLLSYLKDVGANAESIQILLKEPLPDEMLEEISSLNRADVTMTNQITIQALKYGDLLHYEWNTTLLEKTDSHVFVLGEYGRQLHHYTKQNVFTIENWTIEYFSFDSWFTVSADVVGGKIQQYYCNINQPAKMNGNTVSFVDLDLDYVQRKGVWMVVDEDEFEMNAIKFGYPGKAYT